MPTTNSPQRRLKILLSEGSSTSARQTLYALGKRHTIDVLDSARLSQCRFSRFVRRWHRCPSYATDPKGYLECLVQQIRAERYDVLLPTHEQVYLLSRVRDGLQRHVGLALPEFETLDRLQSKTNFARLLEELGLSHPRSRIVRSQEELEQTDEYPCYVKLAHSTAGNGVRLAQDADDMPRIAEEFAGRGVFATGGEILVQAPARGTMSVVQAVYQHGTLVGVHCAEARVRGVGGAPTARISVSHPSVIRDMKLLGDRTGWHGALFLEYFYDRETGRPEYIEANPRIGETLNAVLGGANLCEQLLRVSIDDEVQPLAVGNAGVRTHQGFVTLIAAAMKGASRRDLLGELWRARTRREPYHESQDELTRFREDPLSIVPAAAVVLQLLAAPRSAAKIVRRTVDNYSLPEAAARAIRELPMAALEQSMSV